METYRQFKKDLLGIVLLSLVIQLVWNYGPFGRDASDGNVVGQRSGLAVKIDRETGLHYLEGQGGGLTPRLDANGKQIGSR